MRNFTVLIIFVCFSCTAWSQVNYFNCVIDVDSSLLQLDWKSNEVDFSDSICDVYLLNSSYEISKVQLLYGVHSYYTIQFYLKDGLNGRRKTFHLYEKEPNKIQFYTQDDPFGRLGTWCDRSVSSIKTQIENTDVVFVSVDDTKNEYCNDGNEIKFVMVINH